MVGMVGMKGISPIIATVMLIVVAVSLGALISTWATSWVSDQTNSPDITCSVDTRYVLESAKWNYSGNANKLLVKIRNQGPVKIYNFSATLENSTDLVNYNYSNSNINQGGISEANPLGQEESVYITIDLSSNTALGSSLTKISIGNRACKPITASTTKIEKYS